ncbi:TerB family tellurite resistance protein [Salinispirillum marinum]|uniref:TerB family tellurite resistance protein n=2 Tax=Saccharospirillaceae TaxID=255527 RepID=A0ABV8BI26_9GAMM
MLSKLFEWFNIETKEHTGQPRVELAAAVLMVEIIMADHELAPEEETMLRQRFAETLKLDREAVETLLTEAKKEHDETLDMYQYTRVINEAFSAEEKFALMVDLWRLGYADGHLDRDEDYMLRKVADLLYIPHSDFIMAKQRARGTE